ncbi:MAG: cytochrome C biogenesis protein [Nanoarchaeota archaeon]|nr:cytochrome C biogenesis protein [Nanoarchaeota archaeon]
MLISDIFTSFVLGLLTPLTAVCVLPLYPGFLSYLASRVETGKSRYYPLKLGLLVVSGVLSFMLLLGLLFTTLFEVSLNSIISVVSPIAFGLLGGISVLMIFNVDLSGFFPQVHAPLKKNPFWSAFLFGFFFGTIVIPCNPGFIAAFFARSLLIANPLANMLNFLFFGLGIGAPLLVLALLSSGKSQALITWLTARKKGLNLVAGLIMLGISLYYLIFVFQVFF